MTLSRLETTYAFQSVEAISPADKDVRGVGDKWRGKRTKQHSRNKIVRVFKEQCKRVGARTQTVSTGQDRREDGAQDTCSQK